MSCIVGTTSWSSTAAQDPKMTSYLHQRVKAKMRETTLFVKTVGTQRIAARAKVELACNSIRTQGQSVNTTLGVWDSRIHDVSDGDYKIVQFLMAEVAGKWSTFIMRTTRFATDLLNQMHPCHRVMMSTKPHTAGCHVWKQAWASTRQGKRSKSSIQT